MTTSDSHSDLDPRILGFLCNWCSYAGADLAGVARLQYPSNLRAIRVMCSSRVDPMIVFDALAKGADGVLIAGCHPGDCHYLTGNYQAERNFKAMKKLLARTGLEPERLRLEWVSASEGARWGEVVKDFAEQLRKLGPSKARSDGSARLSLESARDAAASPRIRVLVGREKDFIEKGNVYERTYSQADMDAMLEQTVRDEYLRAEILNLAARPVSVRELSERLGIPGDRVLRHVVRLRKRRMLALAGIEGRSPKYVREMC